MGEKIKYHTDLEAYQLAFDAAMQIFEITKSFPKEEVYSLTDQIRRSSRSACANLSEAWRRRRYRAAFINSLNLVEAEAAETQVWLSFSKECNYLTNCQADALSRIYDHILGIIVTMIKNPDKWIL
ncbi:MAG: four helix bundle protein [Anaerolineales bacterium]|nr:four helix bundle protein [Anaerolineales bacterium]